MAFLPQRQTNNSDNVNVTTNLFTGFSQQSKLIVSAWNTQLSLKFAPFKGKDANGINQYATEYQEMISTALTVDNVGALIKGIEDVIVPSIVSKQTNSVSVSMGNEANRKILTVAYDALKDEVKLTLTYGVTDQGIAADNTSISYTFATKSYLVNYNPATGSSQEVPTQAAFKNFYMKLQDVYKLSPVVLHTQKLNEAQKSAYTARTGAPTTPSYAGGYQAPTVNAGSAAEFLQFN